MKLQCWVLDKINEVILLSFHFIIYKEQLQAILVKYTFLPCSIHALCLHPDVFSFWKLLLTPLSLAETFYSVWHTYSEPISMKALSLFVYYNHWFPLPLQKVSFVSCLSCHPHCFMHMWSWQEINKCFLNKWNVKYYYLWMQILIFFQWCCLSLYCFYPYL